MKRPILINDLYQEGDPNETTDIAIAKALNRQVEYREGIFNVRIGGGAVHLTKHWVAWVDFYDDVESKGWIQDKYHLRIQVDGQQTLDWEVETYNPAFGAITLYMHWHDDNLIYIYAEKHDIYGVTATHNAVRHRVELGLHGTQVHVDQNIVRVIRVEHNPQRIIEQYRLPDWTPLDPLPHDKARELGLLEESEG